MQSNKATFLTVAERCKSILASNWQAYLHTIKADAKGSKEDIYSSKVKFILKRGKPYIWVPEKDMHNLNTVIDERGSLAVASPFPGPLGHLLKAINRLPSRIALGGDVVAVREEKFNYAMKSLKEVLQSEQRIRDESSYMVSSVLSTSDPCATSRSENLKELVDGSENYRVYKFNISSCTYIDSLGRSHEVEMEDIENSKADPLAFSSPKLIHGINQSDTRRRALILFSFVYLNANARDAYVLSVDSKGFDILAKVPSSKKGDGYDGYGWKEFRLSFKEEACDLESFCHRLVEMEEETVKQVSSYSGLNERSSIVKP